MSAVTEKYGWVGDHGERTPEPSYEPDMAAILDGPEEGNAEDDLAACAEVMRGVFALVFAQREGTTAPVKLDLAFRRFVCLTWLTRSGPCARAPACPCSRARSYRAVL